jgi:hypothetical protein
MKFTPCKWLLAMVLAVMAFGAHADLEYAFPERLTPAEQAEQDRKNAQAEAERKAEADRKEAAIKAMGLPPHRRAEAERLYEMRKQAEAARGGPFATAQPKPEPQPEPRQETKAQPKPEPKQEAKAQPKTPKKMCTVPEDTTSNYLPKDKIAAWFAQGAWCARPKSKPPTEIRRKCDGIGFCTVYARCPAYERPCEGPSGATAQ